MSESTIAKSGRDLRAEVEQLIRDDLIGPVGGPDEELHDPPIDVYLLALLAPRMRPKLTTSSTSWSGTNGVADEEPEGSVAFDTKEDPLAVQVGSEEPGTEERPPAVDQFIPSAMGLTFGIAPGVEEIGVTASWGAYARHTSEEKVDEDGRAQRVWRRRPCGDTKVIPLRGRTIAPFAIDEDEPDVKVQGLIRERNGHRLVSLFLVNQQEAVGGRCVEKWLCQSELSVSAPDGSPIFVRRAIDTLSKTPEVDRQELAGLEMLYRDRVEVAAGHGVAVEIEGDGEKPGCATRLTTAAMPAEEVARTDPPSPADFADDAIQVPFEAAVEALDMKRLADTPDGELEPLLSPLVDAYEAWIAAQGARIDDPAEDLADHAGVAREHLDVAAQTATRLRAGIAALADADTAEAFRFANHAMWQQRVHTQAAERRRRDPALKLHEAVELVDVTENRSWRPFQLAFVLLNLPALAEPTHAERDAEGGLVDLLFFPTGGGKTEAYLGLTAFAIAIRRLQGVVAGRDGRDGVTVLMRYTLRLLTLQQFQRAAALLCACEIRRRALYGKGETAEQRRWGTTPMRIGLWVGDTSTPNRTEDAEKWITKARGSSSAPRGSSPMQLARCPWCGSELTAGRDLEHDAVQKRTLTTCSDVNGQCPFTPRNSPGEGLPVVVVDEEIYHLLPALVIATVDKLARMPWEGRAQSLFGQVSQHCPRHGYLTPDEDHVGHHPGRKGSTVVVEACAPLRPPDLVIQDELHLISGPLGSLVGLYETAVDELATWEIDGRRVRAKVIASTATIRRAADQVKRLFDRKLAVFPPPGIDARDSFFALQRDRPEDEETAPGRRYLGVCAPGRRYKQVLIRVYVAQLRAAWTVLGRQPGEAADTYMTLVGYFNSLRELGGMRRLVEDDVQSRLFRPGETGRGRLVLEELTSRKSAAEIPTTLDQLSVPRLDQGKRGEGPYSIDVLLATNMISVGVDVPRLGAMVVAGQPKSTSEYIQATSRVGRAHPGLVMTVYNWSRPRDLSHYETFGHYHRTLYRQVEALSVTPFAPGAVDRGLTGVLASLIRLCGSTYNHNRGAGELDTAGREARRATKTIHDRAEDIVGPARAAALADRIAQQLDAWREEADIGQRNLVYRRRGRTGTDAPLLLEPGIEGWERWTVPTSMRNVELTVPLSLKTDRVLAAPESWEAPEKPAPPPRKVKDA